MYKYEIDPTRTVGTTEQPWECRMDGRTDRWTNGVKPIYPATTSLYNCIIMRSWNVGERGTRDQARAVKLPWLIGGAPLTSNGAPGNIQGNLDRYATPLPEVDPLSPLSFLMKNPRNLGEAGVFSSWKLVSISKDSSKEPNEPSLPWDSEHEGKRVTFCLSVMYHSCSLLWSSCWNKNLV